MHVENTQTRPTLVSQTSSDPRIQHFRSVPSVLGTAVKDAGDCKSVLPVLGTKAV